MNCEKARLLLDAYIDGELSADEMRALEDHAKACEMCMEELQAARLLKDTLEHIDDDITVPLDAQAAWRRAVRAEAKKNNMRKWTRAAYAVAAALVLVFGVSFAFNSIEQQPAEITMQTSLTRMAMVETDGAELAAYSADAASDYTVFKKIAAASADEARNELQILSEEYSGSMTDAGENACRIEIPHEYLEDFLKAASRIGEEKYADIVETEGKTAVILIQIDPA